MTVKRGAQSALARLFVEVVATAALERFNNEWLRTARLIDRLAHRGKLMACDLVADRSGEHQLTQQWDRTTGQLSEKTPFPSAPPTRSHLHVQAKSSRPMRRFLDALQRCLINALYEPHATL